MPPSAAPLVATIHDLAFLSHPEHFSTRGVRFFRRALELALRDARMVTCPSQATIRACVAAGFEADRLRLVPWGTRAETLSADQRERVRSRYGLERPFILFCGTVEPRKNLHRVLEAFRSLDRPDLDLVIAGPKGWREDIEGPLRRLGERATWLGFVPSGRPQRSLRGCRGGRVSEPRGGIRLPRARGDGPRRAGGHVGGDRDRGSGG